MLYILLGCDIFFICESAILNAENDSQAFSAQPPTNRPQAYVSDTLNTSHTIMMDYFQRPPDAVYLDLDGTLVESYTHLPFWMSQKEQIRFGNELERLREKNGQLFGEYPWIDLEQTRDVIQKWHASGTSVEILTLNKRLTPSSIFFDDAYVQELQTQLGWNIPVTGLAYDRYPFLAKAEYLKDIRHNRRICLIDDNSQNIEHLIQHDRAQEVLGLHITWSLFFQAHGGASPFPHYVFTQNESPTTPQEEIQPPPSLSEKEAPEEDVESIASESASWPFSEITSEAGPSRTSTPDLQDMGSIISIRDNGLRDAQTA